MQSNRTLPAPAPPPAPAAPPAAAAAAAAASCAHVFTCCAFPALAPSTSTTTHDMSPLSNLHLILTAAAAAACPRIASLRSHGC